MIVSAVVENDSPSVVRRANDFLIRPFAGLRPVKERAAEVVAAPYDVLTTDEARERARDRPWSMLHVSRPEIDLPADSDPFGPEAYAKARENMRVLVETGILVKDSAPSYYVYRMSAGDHVQTGLAAAASLAVYAEGRIRRHELTRPDKVDDRARQIEAVNAHTGPVAIAHRPLAEATAIYETVTDRPPDCAVTVEDGVDHSLWTIIETEHIAAITRLFDGVDALYIADGHHRTAAATQVADARRSANLGSSDDGAYGAFLAVVFPSDQMRILDYNRVVRDLCGLDANAFVDQVSGSFSVTPESVPVRPARRGEFGMYVAGRWHRLAALRKPPSGAAAVDRLDISILSRQLLEPVLGVGDPREDRRVDFVGGHRGLEGLERLVDSGEMAVAFALYPTSMEDLMAVADSGAVMPPKSTWFDPKLADGLVSYPLD